MTPPRPAQHLLRQAAGALAWGIFFAVVPIMLLFVGVLVWIPVLIWREIVRSHRYGFFPGVLVRLGVVVATVSIAALLPVKYGDRRVRALPRADVTLGELAAAHVLWPIRDEHQKTLRVTLPSTTPTRREVMAAIEQQTGVPFASPSQFPSRRVRTAIRSGPMSTIDVYVIPGTAFARFALLAFACLSIAHTAPCADTPDRPSPDGRISLTVSGTDAASQALEIRDAKTGETTAVSKGYLLPKVDDLTAASIQWSSDSRFFVVSDIAGRGYVGYIVALGKNPQEVRVSGLGNALIEGGELLSFEIDSRNRVILDIRSGKLSRTQIALRVAGDGRVHGSGAK